MIDQLKSELQAALDDLGFQEFTEIQEAVLPLAKLDKSIIGMSETGSGKTHAFLLPIFDKLTLDEHVQAVIIAPTRDLAEQIFKMANHLNSFFKEGFDIRLYIGGSNRERELEKLNKQPQIVIGTPGKLFDFVVKEKKLYVHQTKTFVIDEADMALEEGFLKEIDLVAGMMPDRLQMMVFSATIPKGLEPFLNKYMANPITVKIAANEQVNESIEHILIKTKYQDRLSLLTKTLDYYNPFLALIFSNKKEDASKLALYLNENGYPTAELHGDLPVRVRKQVLRRIKNLEFQYVVASDIAARGIDIQDVSHVINYELPKDNEFYIHRVGRTARAGKEGVAVSFYDYETETYFQELNDKGITFTFKQFDKGELVDARGSFKEEVKPQDLFFQEASKQVPKPKKVKPGYKKKNKALINQKMKEIKKDKFKQWAKEDRLKKGHERKKKNG